MSDTIPRARPGRPRLDPNDETTELRVVLTVRQRRRLRMLAVEQDRSAPAIVRDLIADYLQKQDATPAPATGSEAA